MKKHVRRFRTLHVPTFLWTKRRFVTERVQSRINFSRFREKIFGGSTIQNKTKEVQEACHTRGNVQIKSKYWSTETSESSSESADQIERRRRESRGLRRESSRVPLSKETLQFFDKHSREIDWIPRYSWCNANDLSVFVRRDEVWRRTVSEFEKENSPDVSIFKMVSKLFGRTQHCAEHSQCIPSSWSWKTTSRIFDQ